jgi:hypothetical protein
MISTQHATAVIPLFIGHAEPFDPGHWQEAARAAGFEIIHDQPEIAPARRKRKPNITTLIKRARKAGERGPVRVELVNDDGTRTIVTSSREAAPETMTEAEAEKRWHDRITKNAAH